MSVLKTVADAVFSVIVAIVVALVFATMLFLDVGCAAHGPTLREQVQARSRQHIGAITPAAAVQIGNVTAASASAYVMFVDEKPSHCDGALCMEIVNNHRNPALLTINGQPVTVVGSMGPLLPPGSHGYIRLVHPGTMEIVYSLYDSMRLGDNGARMPLATVLAQCRVTAKVGGANDAYWGGHTTRLGSFFCRRSLDK